jgi:hypothetical protein
MRGMQHNIESVGTQRRAPATHLTVIPAKAGIQFFVTQPRRVAQP